MKIAFRCDASSQIGTGHFMRCLTLADALKQRGAQIRFVSRHLPEHLRNMLETKGHEFMLLDSGRNDATLDELAHAHWLGTSLAQDATDSIQALSGQTWEWLIVDHYALDFRWESMLRQTAKRILVIDDLADRRHDCALLLDQNLVADMESRYDKLLPATCKRLFGPRYALLRQEFSTKRALALARREKTETVKRLLVTLGGTDPDNVTSMVLEGIEEACFDGAVDLVMGGDAPYLEAVQRQAAGMAAPVRVHVATQNMAELMARADLAVGAGGVTSWERCTMGLPSIIVTTAKNQEPIAAGLVRVGAAQWLGASEQVASRRLAAGLSDLVKQVEDVKIMSRAARRLCDGNGTERVVEEMVG
jgi:UDP-2,4-diacetamido-2,4,6-trideoxy-beta-L-altropyranose hydrolase